MEKLKLRRKVKTNLLELIKIDIKLIGLLGISAGIFNF